MTGKSRIGLLQVSAAGVLWGTGGLVVTLLNQRDGLGAMTTSAWRMLLGAVALLAFVAIRRRGGTVVAAFRAHPVRVVLIGCGTAAYQGLYFVSVLLVGVSVATVIALGLAPILASVWVHTSERTPPAPRELLVLGSALLGLVLITFTAGNEAGGTAGNPALGLTLAVLAGATYAATTLLGESLAHDVGPTALTTAATGVGAIALAPFLTVAAAGGDPVFPQSVWSLTLLVYLGVATMALSYGLLYAGLRTTPGSAATVATLVEPVSAAVFAAVILSERLSGWGVLGGVLILAAVVALAPERELDSRGFPGPV